MIVISPHLSKDSESFVDLHDTSAKRAKEIGKRRKRESDVRRRVRLRGSRSCVCRPERTKTSGERFRKESVKKGEE